MDPIAYSPVVMVRVFKVSMSIAANSSQTLFFRLVCFSFALIGSVLIARLLGPEGRGEYALFMLALNLGSVFTTFAVVNNVSFVIARYQLSQDESFTLTSFFLVLCLFLAGSILLAINFFECSLLNGVLLKYSLYIYIGIFVFSLRTGMSSILLGLGKIRQVNYSEFFTALYPFLLVFLLFQAPLNVEKTIVATLACALFGAVYSLYVLSPFKLKIASDKLFESTRALSVIFVSFLAGTLNLRVGLFFVGSFLTTREAGIYSVSQPFAELLFLIPGILGSVSVHRFGMETDAGADRLLASSIRKLILLNAGCSLGIAAVTSVLIPLFYGKAFQESFYVLLILIVGFFCYSIPLLTTGYFNIKKSPYFNLLIAGFTLTLGSIFSWILIPKFGIYGAAVATSMSYLLGTVLDIYIILNVSNLRFKDICLMRHEDFDAVIMEVKKQTIHRFAIRGSHY